jgi:ribosomal protein S18 acetylase RimI-like enzyme
MPNFVECKFEDIEELQKLSQITYLNSFSTILNEEDVKKYISTKYSLENLKAELEDKTTQFLFLTLGNEKIGYLKYNYDSLKLENSLNIDRIYLLDAYKGKGFGTKLLQKIESIAIKNNKSYLTLGVLKFNKPAVSFYEKNNFSVFDEETIVIGNNNYILLHMIKNI